MAAFSSTAAGGFDSLENPKSPRIWRAAETTFAGLGGSAALVAPV
jgi:hypothetical protein